MWEAHLNEVEQALRVTRESTGELVLDVPAGKYDEAGHLVAWLLATHGAEKFMALYARTTRGMSGADLSPTPTPSPASSTVPAPPPAPPADVKV